MQTARDCVGRRSGQTRHTPSKYCAQEIRSGFHTRQTSLVSQGAPRQTGGAIAVRSTKTMLRAWCCLVLVLGVCTGQAAMRKLSLNELVSKADTIVLGTVIQQESAWDVQHTAIYTKVTLAVERMLVGLPREVVTLQVAGGTVGDMGMRTSNDAVFREGERVIVCLDTSAVPGSVVGLQQGKFLVQDDTVSTTEETWDLDAFIAAVRAIAR